MATVYKIEGELAAYGASQSFTGLGTLYDYAQFRTTGGRLNVDAVNVPHAIEPAFSVGTTGTFYVSKTRNRAFIYAATVNGENYDCREVVLKGVRKSGRFFDIFTYGGVVMIFLAILNPMMIAAGLVAIMIGGPFTLYHRLVTSPKIPKGPMNSWAGQAVPLNA